ncbi:hypothetical protein [Vibrio cholerae]|uniref:hypothetical protein n=1 Tax=Vibrio cholerae TaxID=666 RepID=UPI0015612A51|nr:hypothetical protein [Vibrio cholerae]EGQ9647872.1 hypothetical protein [Vibrio cholerae]EJL6639993.1 hypothetical protein [Vibrio cholerae]NOF76063.1 hypothetical protein [Vibrio cholerae]
MSDNIFLQTLSILDSNRIKCRAFTTLFIQDENQTWDEFLLELEDARPSIESFCDSKSILEIKPDKEAGTIFVSASPKFIPS